MLDNDISLLDNLVVGLVITILGGIITAVLLSYISPNVFQSGSGQGSAGRPNPSRLAFVLGIIVSGLLAYVVVRPGRPPQSPSVPTPIAQVAFQTAAAVSTNSVVPQPLSTSTATSQNEFGIAPTEASSGPPTQTPPIAPEFTQVAQITEPTPHPPAPQLPTPVLPTPVPPTPVPPTPVPPTPVPPTPVPPTPVPPTPVPPTPVPTEPILTQVEANRLFEAGNWFCFPDTTALFGVRNIPDNFLVPEPLSYVDTYLGIFTNGQSVDKKDQVIGGTVYLKEGWRLPRTECPHAQQSALAAWDTHQEPLTKDVLDSKLGPGNWTCIAGFRYAAVVEEHPSNMLVEFPYTSVDHNGRKYAVGDRVPGGGRATIWMRDSIPDGQCYVLVSLQGVAQNQVPETNALGLPPGKKNLLGLPFETGWTVTTQNSDFPNYPTLVPLNVNISNPISVYLLIQGGWSFKEFAGMQVGVVTLSFAGGSVKTIPLILGDNIRDWSRDDPSAVTTYTSPTLREAFQGVVPPPDGRRGGMDILTIDIPQELAGATLTGITIEDTSRGTTGSENPALHLLGITVRHQP